MPNIHTKFSAKLEMSAFLAFYDKFMLDIFQTFRKKSEIESVLGTISPPQWSQDLALDTRCSPKQLDPHEGGGRRGPRLRRWRGYLRVCRYQIRNTSCQDECRMRLRNHSWGGFRGWRGRCSVPTESLFPAPSACTV